MQPIDLKVLGAGALVFSMAMLVALSGRLPRMLRFACALTIFVCGQALVFMTSSTTPSTWTTILFTGCAAACLYSFWLLSRQRRALPGWADVGICPSPTDVYRHLPSFIVDRNGVVNSVHQAALRFVGGDFSAIGESPAPHLNNKQPAERTIDIRNLSADQWHWLTLGSGSDCCRVLALAIPLPQDYHQVFIVDPPTPELRDDLVYAQAIHDLRAPATTVQGYAEWMLGDGSLEIQQRSHLETIQRNACHQLELVDQFLGVAKGKEVEVDTEPTNIPALLQDTVDSFQPQADAADVGLVLGRSDIPFYVNVDAIRLRRIVNNLTSNAIKFTGEGIVSVGADWENTTTDGTLTIEVKDTGRGIPHDLVKDLFTPFSQGQTADSGRSGGVGLGLSIVKKLVTEMGGKVSVVSELDQGSSFQVTIPAPIAMLGPAEDKDRLESSGEAQVEPFSRVLVVDDAPDALLLITRRLERSGVKVTGFTDVERALAQLRSEDYDLVIFDLEMPGTGGLEAVTWLRREGFEMPAIALTAHTNETIHDLCQSAGFNGCLSKPFSMVKLQNLMKRTGQTSPAIG